MAPPLDSLRKRLSPPPIHKPYGLVLWLLLGLAGAPSWATGQEPHQETGLVGLPLHLDATDILALSPEMRAFLDQHTGDNQVRARRLRNLMTAIFEADGLGIKYGNSRTKTAAETFATASGNCLSFTLMFVTMARELGLDAYFVEVDEVTSWSSESDVDINADINAWHMFAEVGLDNGFVKVDFLPGIDKRYRRQRRIKDSRVAAHYFNNLGVEALTAGHPEAARALLLRALELDGKFTPALVNLGVAHRRADDLEAAEKSLLRALDLDRSNLQAMRNLASLYQGTGRGDRAEPLMKKVDRYLDRNPFHHYRLSQKAAAAGRWQQAADHLALAIRRQFDVSRFHEAQATALRHLGKPDKAEDSLRRAINLTEDENRRQLLEARLAEWQAPPG